MSASWRVKKRHFEERAAALKINASSDEDWRRVWKLHMRAASLDMKYGNLQEQRRGRARHARHNALLRAQASVKPEDVLGKTAPRNSEV